MPWCDFCSHFFNPNALTEAGNCPKCGAGLNRQSFSLPAPRNAGQKQPALKHQKVPWHFWLLASAAGIYLSWRLVQGVAALVS